MELITGPELAIIVLLILLITANGFVLLTRPPRPRWMRRPPRHTKVPEMPEALRKHCVSSPDHEVVEWYIAYCRAEARAIVAEARERRRSRR